MRSELGLMRGMRILAAALAAVWAAALSAAAEDGATTPRSFVGLSAGYSDRYGPTVGAETYIHDLFRSGASLRFAAERNRDGFRLFADLDRQTRSKRPAFGSYPLIDLGVFGDVQAWQDQAYKTSRVGGRAALRWDVGVDAQSSLGYHLSYDSIYDVRASTSPLVAAEAGGVLNSGLRLGYRLDRLRHRPPGNAGYRLGAHAEIYGLGGAARWAALAVDAHGVVPLHERNRFILKGAGGLARGFGGYDLRITDRAFLGGNSIRGFEYAGIGPADSNGSVTTHLGGESYVNFSAEFEHDFYERRGHIVSASAFADFGSVWGLSRTTGGFLPQIDDSFSLRGAAGIGVSWTGPAAEVSVYFAQPFLKQTLDIPKSLGISVRAKF